MKYKIKIESIASIDEIDGAWSKDDYIELLKRFDFADEEAYANVDPKEFLFMAISEMEPGESAAILLDYKLSEYLNEGQISQMSHDMQIDKISEEYPEISLHYPLFNINQLLYKAYNGKFPHAKASRIDFTMEPENSNGKEVTKEEVLKAFGAGLSSHSILKRLFSDQLEGTVKFKEPDNIVWELNSKGNAQYSLITSEYWLSEEDFEELEFEGNVIEFAEETRE